jgi:sterol O-acyltransferase
MLPASVAQETTITEITLKIPLEATDRSAITKVAGQVIANTDSTAYVLKTSRSPNSKKLRAAVAFIPRLSHFDVENERSGTNEFRGFFTLFWMSLFIWTVRTYIRSIERHGVPLNFQFATMISKDARTLALTDAVLVLSTGICVPFAKAVNRGWIKYYWTGVIIQHTLQTFILFAAIKWTFNRQWPWVQSGFLTLHTFVMIMKMHSYMATNGYLKHVSQQSAELLTQLRDATSRVGGWETAISEALNRRETGADLSPGTSISSIPTPELSDSASSSYVQAHTTAALRNRLIHATESTDDKPKDLTPSVLVDHPDPEISALATEYVDLESELVSSGPERVRWPENITFKNFAVYQLIPTLVYELEFPRTNKIRPLYVFEKTVATFGTFALLYTTTETFILPYTNPSPEQSFARTLLDLALPFMLAYLLLFLYHIRVYLQRIRRTFIFRRSRVLRGLVELNVMG